MYYELAYMSEEDTDHQHIQQDDDDENQQLLDESFEKQLEEFRERLLNDNKMTWTLTKSDTKRNNCNNTTSRTRKKLIPNVSLDWILEQRQKLDELSKSAYTYYCGQSRDGGVFQSPRIYEDADATGDSDHNRSCRASSCHSRKEMRIMK